MANENGNAIEVAQDCVYLSDKLHVPSGKLEAAIARAREEWHGLAGDVFVSHLFEINEMAEQARRQLLLLAQKLQMSAIE